MSKIGFEKNAAYLKEHCERVLVLPKSITHKIASEKISPRRDEYLNPNAIHHDIKPAPLFKITRKTPISSTEEQYHRDALAKSPPNCSLPPTKSPIHTFNHTHEFVIKDGFLWYRVQGETTFKPLYFDGYPHVSPIIVDSDGANLIVIDNNHQCHYRKILEEFRCQEIDDHHQQLIEEQGGTPHEMPYVAFDISEENNWIPTWFSLPVASNIVNFFHKTHLCIPDGARAVAISQRGRYNDYVEDCLGTHHPVGTGVTTVYVLSRNGQDIEKFDPWSPPWAKTTIGLKETHGKSFVANNISVSASTIMAIGYEYNHHQKNYELKIITMLADIDTIGSNPGIKYSFVKDAPQKDTRILPIDADWQEHPLILKDKAMVTESITIRQTGEGNNARQLRIFGKNHEGAWGYWHKMINDSSFKFTITKPPDFPEQALMPIPPLKAHSSVHDYEGVYDNLPMRLVNFGKRSNHAQIFITINKKEYCIDLFKRYALSTFIGRDSYTYDVVIKSDDAILHTIFGNHKTFGVKVKERDDEVSIRSPASALLHPFKLVFHKCAAR